MPIADKKARQKYGREWMRAWRKANPDKDYALYLKYATTRRARINYTRHGAKRRGLAWALSQEFLDSLPMVCFYSKTPLTLEPKKFNTWSLDRIDNSLGYIESNVVQCCWGINKLKGTLGVEEFFNMCRMVIGK
jgi:hypothetical protein